MTAEQSLSGSPARRWGQPGLRTRRRVPIPRWCRDLVGSLTWVSLLVVLALWVSGGGLQDLTDMSTGLISAGRLTGLLASDLLLIQVLLMARIPVVERVYGRTNSPDGIAGSVFRPST